MHELPLDTRYDPPVLAVVCASAVLAACQDEHPSRTEPWSRGGHASRVLPRNPVMLGKYLADLRGWQGPEWTCLFRLWNRESGWRVKADTRVSGLDARDAREFAYGIPQARPASKMGPRYRVALVQIRWGLRYISTRYGSPCAALAHSDATSWY